MIHVYYDLAHRRGLLVITKSAGITGFDTLRRIGDHQIQASESAISAKVGWKCGRYVAAGGAPSRAPSKTRDFEPVQAWINQKFRENVDQSAAIFGRRCARKRAASMNFKNVCSCGNTIGSKRGMQ